MTWHLTLLWRPSTWNKELDGKWYWNDFGKYVCREVSLVCCREVVNAYPFQEGWDEKIVKLFCNVITAPAARPVNVLTYCTKRNTIRRTGIRIMVSDLVYQAWNHPVRFCGTRQAILSNHIRAVCLLKRSGRWEWSRVAANYTSFQLFQGIERTVEWLDSQSFVCAYWRTSFNWERHAL